MSLDNLLPMSLDCTKYASDFTLTNGGKPWKYILIPHNIVQVNMGFDTLVTTYEYKSE